MTWWHDMFWGPVFCKGSHQERDLEASWMLDGLGRQVFRQMVHFRTEYLSRVGPINPSGLMNLCNRALDSADERDRSGLCAASNMRRTIRLTLKRYIPTISGRGLRKVPLTPGHVPRLMYRFVRASSHLAGCTIAGNMNGF